MREQIALTTRNPWMYLLSSGTQAIPDSTWTKVTFSSNSFGTNMPSNAGGTTGTFLPWRSGTPTRLYLPQVGNLVLICEVCFQADATPAAQDEIRAVRTVSSTLTSSAPLEIVTQVACKVPAAVGAGQHLMIDHYGPVEKTGTAAAVTVGSYIELEVWQNSGGPLNLKSDGIAANQIMAFYVDS